MPDALPRATIAHHLIGLTAWLHNGLGVTIDQIVDILGYHLQAELTAGGLINAWQRLSEILLAWYERIGEEAKNSAYLPADARRLTKRLCRYGEYLFTFLDYPYVAADNNFGERQIRPAVILRENPDASGSNHSDHGVAAQAILMSVYRTLRLRGLNPTKSIADALQTYLITGRLPALPV